MICEAILKDEQIMYLYWRRQWTCKNWTYTVTLALLSCLTLSVVTDCSLFMLVSAAISLWSLIRNCITKDYLDWVKAFADGWATVRLEDEHARVTSRSKSYIFKVIIDGSAQPDTAQVDFIHRVVYMTQSTFDALYAGSTEIIKNP